MILYTFIKQIICDGENAEPHWLIECENAFNQIVIHAWRTTNTEIH